MARPAQNATVRARRRWQLALFALVLLVGAQFTLWAFAHLAGRPPLVPRPAGVEGFLPISALLSLRLWLAGGGIHPVHPAGLAILLAALAMSLVVAKSFCSHICPVGAVSEWLGNAGAKLLGATWRLPVWLDLPLRSFKYLLLLFFLWAVWVSMDLVAVQAFLDSPYNRVADVKMLLFFASPSRLTVAVVGVLVVGSVLVRDLWCRYLCPYGALLGLLGRLAPLKVTREPARCTQCRACTRVCPARLPVHTLRRVSSVECSSCQECLAACPAAGCLAVRPPRWVAPTRRLAPGRAVVVAVGVFLAVTGAFRLAGHWRGCVSEGEYARRLAEIHSPVYLHPGGRPARRSVPSTTRALAAEVRGESAETTLRGSTGP